MEIGGEVTWVEYGDCGRLSTLLVARKDGGKDGRGSQVRNAVAIVPLRVVT